jgi:alpha-D-ribose 1-methylphosphonate 5-triphosphate synthase subunit PhnH
VTTPTLTPRAEREQRTFRTLLDTMARPGTLRTLPLAEPGVQSALVAIAEALVDHEVTFAVFPERADLADAILRQTGSFAATVERADYVFTEPESLADALRQAKEGSPEYPDAGATVICRINSLTEGEALTLSGPGIRDSARIHVEGFWGEARAAFAERNALPPLGLDLVLVSPDGGVVCLGRYTRIQEEN